MLKFMLNSLLCFVCIAFFSTSVYAGGSFTFKLGKDSEPAQQQATQVTNKKNGPPAHAKAHGYRAKHQYRYYPDQKVYHDPDKGLYFYLKGDSWEVGAKLPSTLSAGLGESVSIELDTDKPYTQNADHVKQYPPKKSGGATNKKLAKKGKK